MISAFDYQVNNLGQRTSVATSGSEFAVATGWQWGYDALGQVKSAAHATNSAFHRSYRYDDIGNRKQSSPELQLAPAATTNYAPNLLNQYSSITPPGAAAFNPGYDEDGNQLSAFRAPSSAFQYVWDAENRLKLVKDAQGNVLVRYAYDAQSRLIRKTQPGPGTAASASTGCVYDGWNCVAQYNLLTQPALLMRRQTWGSDLSRTMQGAGGVGGLLAVESLDAANPGAWFPTYDGNGNVSEYLGTNGAVAAHFEYDAFGNTISSTGNASAFNYRFSTKPQDAVTGLYYYGYRWYDVVTGRWPSRDPIGEKGGANLYGFTRNRPVRRFDRIGLVDKVVDFHVWVMNKELFGADKVEVDLVAKMKFRCTLENGIEKVESQNVVASNGGDDANISIGAMEDVAADKDMFLARFRNIKCKQFVITGTSINEDFNSTNFIAGSAAVGGVVVIAGGPEAIPEGVAVGGVLGTIGAGVAESFDNEWNLQFSWTIKVCCACHPSEPNQFKWKSVGFNIQKWETNDSEFYHSHGTEGPPRSQPK